MIPTDKFANSHLFRIYLVAVDPGLAFNWLVERENGTKPTQFCSHRIGSTCGWQPDTSGTSARGRLVILAGGGAHDRIR